MPLLESALGSLIQCKPFIILAGTFRKVAYASFTHAALTTRYRTKSLYCIKVFLCCKRHAILVYEQDKNLLKIVDVKDLEIRFHKHQDLVCKRGIYKDYTHLLALALKRFATLRQNIHSR